MTTSPSRLGRPISIRISAGDSCKASLKRLFTILGFHDPAIVLLGEKISQQGAIILNVIHNQDGRALIKFFAHLGLSGISLTITGAPSLLRAHEPGVMTAKSLRVAHGLGFSSRLLSNAS